MENQIQISGKKFIQEWKRDSEKLIKINSISDVFTQKTPSLVSINKNYGKDFMIDYLLMWLIEINNLLGGKLEDFEIETLAVDVYEQFYFLTIGDLKMIVRKIKSTKFYHINAQEINMVFQNYFNERCDKAQEFSEMEHHKMKGEWSNVGNGKNRELKRIREKFHKQKLETYKNSKEAYRKAE